MNIRTEGRTRVAPSHPFAPTSLRGLLAGLAILFCAMVIDRIISSWASSRQAALGL